MKKPYVILLHIGFWLCYFIAVLIVLGAYYGRNEATAEAQIQKAFESIFFFVLLPSATSFYGFYYILFARFFRKEKYVLSALYGVVIAVCAALVGWLCLYQIHKDSVCGNGEEGLTETFWGMVIFMTLVGLVFGVFAFVIRGFITWFEEVKQKEALTQKNLEMEMALVKSQLDPHFLFNTINNIDVLILKNADIASDYLNKLSDIMRFMLFETKTEQIPLSKEIEYIEKYIELQRIRTSNDSYVDLKITGNPEGKMIAPMLFIPFIENAFKHTNNKKTEDAIIIEIRIEESRIVMICDNKFDPTRKTQQESHGLGNTLIEKRLNLIYPKTHLLRIDKKDDEYKVYLEINHG